MNHPVILGHTRNAQPDYMGEFSRPQKPAAGCKGPVKLINRIKIAHLSLQFVSNQFYFIVLILPMWFYKWLSKNFCETDL